MTDSVDVAIVGAGIVGLAQALAAAQQGYRVAVFERQPQALGASIRNFGLVWPVGQPEGPLYERARRSRALWLELAGSAGFQADPCGSLHLAYAPDELAVLEEFVAGAEARRDTIALLTPEQAIAKSPAVVPDGLLGALWSSTEVIVDPRQAIALLPPYLTEKYGVRFYFNTAIREIAYPTLASAQQSWRAERIRVCSGADFETLYPHLYARSGLTKVKLQMLRTVPQPSGWRAGAALCAGLTLTHYAAFAACPSLPALAARIAQETPQFPQWGIHVMLAQNASGELILGDSHEYGPSPDPFDRTEINDLILGYLGRFARFPDPRIAATWHGVYAKLPGQTEWIVEPEPGVTVINALSGAGMTLSWGLAAEMFADAA